MNNYCTNCGEKLREEELACTKCNTPVVNLPHNYNYQSEEDKKKKKNKIVVVLIVLLLLVLCLFLAVFVLITIPRLKIKTLQQQYVEPYIKEKYTNKKYEIDYKGSGSCLISGQECSSEFLESCAHPTGSDCVWLDEKECKSYYFNIKTDTDEILITVFYKDNKYSLVEGKNINGQSFEEEIENEI